MSSTGVLLAGNNVSQGNVTQVGNFDCFSGLSFPVSDAQATPDYFNGTPQFQTQLQARESPQEAASAGRVVPADPGIRPRCEDGQRTLTTVAFHILFLN